jgi:hypothetical protein
MRSLRSELTIGRSRGISVGRFRATDEPILANGLHTPRQRSARISVYDLLNVVVAADNNGRLAGPRREAVGPSAGGEVRRVGLSAK